MKLKFEQIALLLFALYCGTTSDTKSNAQTLVAVKKYPTVPRPKTFQSDKDTIKSSLLLIKSAEKQNPGILGCDSAILYSSRLGKFYLYDKYTVLMVDCGNNIPIVKVYADSSRTSHDAISHALNDEPIFTLKDYGLWFNGIKEDFIFINRNSGVGPTGLTVINLASKDTAYETFFDGEITIDSTYSLVYFGPADEEATKENDPNYEECKKGGLTPVIEEDVSFNLLTQKETKLGHKKYTCYQ
jgi:hypothetical protein